MKKDGPKASTAIHGPLGLTYQPKKKSNVIADCKENKFISHDLCHENHERQVEASLRFGASLDGTPLGKVRPCDMHNLANSLKLKKACGLSDIPNECLKHLPRKPLVYLTHLFNHMPSAVTSSKALEENENYNGTETG
jgi:hypothetical protein